MIDRLLNLTEFCVVWGPLDLPEPAYSFADDWVSQIYTQEEIAEAILTVPGARLTNPATPRWQAWAARWQETNRHIDFDIIPWEIDPENELRPAVAIAWGGSKFEMHCLLSDVYLCGSVSGNDVQRFGCMTRIVECTHLNRLRIKSLAKQPFV